MSVRDGVKAAPGPTPSKKPSAAFVYAKGGHYNLEELNTFLADPANGLSRSSLDIFRRLIDDGSVLGPEDS